MRRTRGKVQKPSSKSANSTPVKPAAKSNSSKAQDTINGTLFPLLATLGDSTESQQIQNLKKLLTQQPTKQVLEALSTLANLTIEQLNLNTPTVDGLKKLKSIVSKLKEDTSSVKLFGKNSFGETLLIQLARLIPLDTSKAQKDVKSVAETGKTKKAEPNKKEAYQSPKTQPCKPAKAIQSEIISPSAAATAEAAPLTREASGSAAAAAATNEIASPITTPTATPKKSTSSLSNVTPTTKAVLTVRNIIKLRDNHEITPDKASELVDEIEVDGVTPERAKQRLGELSTGVASGSESSQIEDAQNSILQDGSSIVGSPAVSPIKPNGGQGTPAEFPRYDSADDNPDSSSEDRIPPDVAAPNDNNEILRKFEEASETIQELEARLRRAKDDKKKMIDSYKIDNEKLLNENKELSETNKKLQILLKDKEEREGITTHERETEKTKFQAQLDSFRAKENELRSEKQELLTQKNEAVHKLELLSQQHKEALAELESTKKQYEYERQVHSAVVIQKSILRHRAETRYEKVVQERATFESQAVAERQRNQLLLNEIAQLKSAQEEMGRLNKELQEKLSKITNLPQRTEQAISLNNITTENELRAEIKDLKERLEASGRIENDLRKQIALALPSLNEGASQHQVALTADSAAAKGSTEQQERDRQIQSEATAALTQKHDLEKRALIEREQRLKHEHDQEMKTLHDRMVVLQGQYAELVQAHSTLREQNLRLQTEYLEQQRIFESNASELNTSRQQQQLRQEESLTLQQQIATLQRQAEQDARVLYELRGMTQPISQPRPISPALIPSAVMPALTAALSPITIGQDTHQSNENSSDAILARRLREAAQSNVRTLAARLEAETLRCHLAVVPPQAPVSLQPAAAATAQATATPVGTTATHTATPARNNL